MWFFVVLPVGLITGWCIDWRRTKLAVVFTQGFWVREPVMANQGGFAPVEDLTMFGGANIRRA